MLAVVLFWAPVVGGLLGTMLLTQANARWLKIGVIVLGVTLSAALFWRGSWITAY